MPQRQDGGQFHDKVDPRKIVLRIQRPHHGNVKTRKKIAEERKVRDEIAQKEYLESSQTIRGIK